MARPQIDRPSLVIFQRIRLSREVSLEWVLTIWLKILLLRVLKNSFSILSLTLLFLVQVPRDFCHKTKKHLASELINLQMLLSLQKQRTRIRQLFYFSHSMSRVAEVSLRYLNQLQKRTFLLKREQKTTRTMAVQKIYARVRALMPSANLNRLKREEVRLLCQTLDVLRTMRNLKIYNCSSSNNLNCLKKIIRLIKHLHDKNQLTQKIQIWALASMRFALT